MRKYLAIAIVMLCASPSLASDGDWWLVSGQPGDSSVQFIDASSIERDGASVSFTASTYWETGRSMDRDLTMDCNTRPEAQSYADLWAFACGSEDVRMSSGLMLGSTDPKWLAKTVFAMPS